MRSRNEVADLEKYLWLWEIKGGHDSAILPARVVDGARLQRDNSAERAVHVPMWELRMLRAVPLALTESGRDLVQCRIVRTVRLYSFSDVARDHRV